MARLVFLGRLEDLAGSAELERTVPNLAAALEELPSRLREEVAGGKVRFALNGAVLPATADPAAVALAESDELALLPPVSGG
jgi:molybdopterin synthase sulfur carrier subunit